MAPSNNKNVRSSKLSICMEDGKSMSKNLMYTPLVAYELDDSFPSESKHPSRYTKNNPSVVKSLNESSLVSILHFVSCDHHHNRTIVNDAKNNGSRPLAAPDVGNRIRQRAVTLLGKGINSSIPTVKRTIRPKKRRRRSWEESKLVLKNLSSEAESFESELVGVVSFLRKLNSAWNTYVWKVLANEKGTNHNTQISDDALREIEIRFEALVGNRLNNRRKCDYGASGRKDLIEREDSIDLIGAHVLIKNCRSYRSSVGRFGILIGETTNTYRIASYTRERTSNHKKTLPTRKEKTESIRSDACNTKGRAESIEILVLPKLGSCLQFILPCLFNDRNKDQKPRLEEDITLETMVVVPDEVICISVEEE